MAVTELVIRDHTADTGAEPTSGVTWESPDIIVRNDDDDGLTSQPLVTEQPNFVYVRVTNRGRQEARDINVDMRAAFPATTFVHPGDWTAIDMHHIKPVGLDTHFQRILPGETARAKFRFRRDDVDTLYAWQTAGSHPCLIAEVRTGIVPGTAMHYDNPTPAGAHMWESNNLAQRNVSVIAIARKMMRASYRFMAGSRFDFDDHMHLVVDRAKLPKSARLLLDPSDARPIVPVVGRPFSVLPFGTKTRLLDRARFLVALCGSEAVVTLEPGSVIEYGNGSHAPLSLQGAEWLEDDERQRIAVRAETAVIGVPKAPGEMRPMALTVQFANDTPADQTFPIRLSHRNRRGEVVGGVTVVFEIV